VRSRNRCRIRSSTSTSTSGAAAPHHHHHPPKTQVPPNPNHRLIPSTVPSHSRSRYALLRRFHRTPDRCRAHPCRRLPGSNAAAVGAASAVVPASAAAVAALADADDLRRRRRRRRSGRAGDGGGGGAGAERWRGEWPFSPPLLSRSRIPRFCLGGRSHGCVCRSPVSDARAAERCSAFACGLEFRCSARPFLGVAGGRAGAEEQCSSPVPVVRVCRACCYRRLLGLGLTGEWMHYPEPHVLAAGQS
jgi:hypothetical protein